MQFPVFLSILAVTTTCIVLWKRRRLYYLSYILKGPFALPFIGNLLDLIKNPEDIIEKTIEERKKYGSPFRVWFGTKLLVYTSNPEDFEILLNSPHALIKNDIICEFYKPLVGEGLGTCENVSRWRRNRKLMTRMFNQRALNEFLLIFQDNSLILCEELGKMVERGNFDVHSWLARCHIDIIFETTTGVKVNAQKEESIYMDSLERLYDVMYSRLVNPLLHSNFIFKRTAVGAQHEKLLNYIRNFNKNMIESKRKQRGQTSQNGCSNKSKVFLDYLLESGQFSDNELNYEIATLIVAGTDTGVAVESFTLMLLGMHQKVQDEVFKEQQNIFGVIQREITHVDLSQMTYLERVIKESMRLFPATGVLLRTVTNDVQLPTCTLPKGTPVILGVLDAHRNPSLWKDSLKFDPDRFLPERISEKQFYSYIPFSAGSRDCIGQRYGMMVAKVILSIITRKYKFFCEYKNVEDIKVIQHMALSPKDGFKISLKLRN